MKNVKKMLTEQADKILPDDSVKENIKRELNISASEAALSYAHGGESSARTNTKNKLIAAFAAIVVVALALVIALSLIFKDKNQPFSPFPAPGNKFTQITNADTFYAYGAASVGTMLSSLSQDKVSGLKTSGVRLASFDEENFPTDDVNRYMALVENLLGGDEIKETVVSGDMGYEYGMTVSYTDLLGNTVDYTMYYDKIFLSSDSDKGESEENYSIIGILITDTGNYPVEGKYETESESEGGESESESELYFKAFTNAEKTSYIEVEQESESENEGGESESETKYSYSVFVGGVMTEKTVVEYENEDGELEVKLLITTNDGENTTLTFKDESKKNQRILFVRGEMNGKDVSFRVYVSEGQYRYEFQDGSSSDHGRYHDDDDDDEEEDDDDD